MSGYIPKEQLNAYRRWQLDSFDSDREDAARAEPEPAAEPAPEVVTEFSLPTAEDIERIHNEAHESGYQAGFAEGQQEGYRAGYEVAHTQAERLAALADNFESALAGIDQSVAEQVLALALEVASQVLRSTVVARPESLLPVIREAIAALPLHHGHVMLHINPAEVEMVREHLGEQFLNSGWRIVEDKEIEPGGCLLKAGSSEVDGTLETRWKRVLETIGADPANWLEQQ